MTVFISFMFQGWQSHVFHGALPLHVTINGQTLWKSTKCNHNHFAWENINLSDTQYVHPTRLLPCVCSSQQGQLISRCFHHQLQKWQWFWFPPLIRFRFCLGLFIGWRWGVLMSATLVQNVIDEDFFLVQMSIMTFMYITSMMHICVRHIWKHALYM